MNTKKTRVRIALVMIIAVLIISCKSTPLNQVKYGYMECLKLDADELRMDPIDSVSLNEYEVLCFYAGTELWLNRVLTGKNKTYIGMSTRLAPQEYISLMKKDSAAEIFQSREYSNNNKLYHAFFLKKSDRFIYRTLYTEPSQGDMLLYDITNSDSLKMSALYNNQQYLINKLDCE